MIPKTNDNWRIMCKIAEVAEEYGIEFKELTRIEPMGTNSEGDTEYAVTIGYDSGRWCFTVVDNGFLEHDIREKLFRTQKEAAKKARILKGIKNKYNSFFDFYQKVIDEIQKQDWASKFVGYFVEEVADGLFAHHLYLNRIKIKEFVHQSPMELTDPDCPRLVVEAFNYQYLWSKMNRTEDEVKQILAYEEKYHIKGDKL